MIVPQHPLFALRQIALEILARALKELYPGVTLVKKELTALGFYYDVVFPFLWQEEFLPVVEEKMWTLIRKKLPLTIQEMVADNAATYLTTLSFLDEAEKLEGRGKEIVSILRMGDYATYWEDPLHFPLPSHTGEVKHLKLYRSYLLENHEKSRVRILGAVFADARSLKEALKNKRASEGHLLLGREMDLFSLLTEETKKGCIWHPRGEKLRYLLYSFWKELQEEEGFSVITTPSCTVTGSELEGLSLVHEQFFISYCQSLPVRFAECRYLYAPLPETSYEGILSTPCAHFERAHVFCEEAQIVKECTSSLQFILKVFKMLGLEWEMVFYPQEKTSHKRKKRTRFLQEALSQIDLSYETCETVGGGERGPRIVFFVSDALGVSWPVAFLELSEPFLGLQKEGGYEMITRSFFHSLERCIALLLEKGEIPFWLAPEQVRIALVGKEARGYAESLYKELIAFGIRVELDERSLSLGQKIYEASLHRIPYTVVVGEKEMRLGNLTIREGKQEQVESRAAFLALLQKKKTRNL